MLIQSKTLSVRRSQREVTANDFIKNEQKSKEEINRNSKKNFPAIGAAVTKLSWCEDIPFGNVELE